jgi:hypothetical protein
VRAYVGERVSDGTSQVWHVEIDDREAADAMHQVLGLRSIAAGVLDGERGRRLLTMRMEWTEAEGADALARAVLRRELAVEPTPMVIERFSADVVGQLPAELFVLTAEQVWRWVVAQRALIDYEQFLSPIEDLPSLAVVDEPTASAVVAACERAWRSIQAHHPEVPDAVIVLGSGVERGRLVKLGHWWGGRWLADGQVRGEVLIAGEALHLEPAQVFEVMLHEAAHGINAARGIKDTSRGGRYHNQRYASAAKEVLLRVRPMPPYGMAETLLSAAAAERYADDITGLGEAMRIARQLERATTREPGADDSSGGDDREKASGRSTSAACGCGRRVRVAPSTLAAGPIVCGLCGSAFAEPKTADRAEVAPAAAVVDQTFLERRRQQLDIERQTPDDPARLERHHARLDAVVAELAPTAPDVTSLLRERLDRLRALRGEPEHRVPVTPEQRGGLADLARELLQDGDGDAVRRWYERVGTSHEEPMPAAHDVDEARRLRLARALLRADGTLRGPEVSIGREPLAAGDRVIVTGPNGVVPVGTLGTVEAVDAEAAEVDIDFSTWGRLRVGSGDAVLRSLRHDYVTEVDPLPPEVELDRFLPEPLP